MREHNDRSGFKKMEFFFKIRDILFPRKRILNEVGISEGMQIIEFGCGPGSYTIPLSRLVGEQGKIYAVDRNPIALETTSEKLTKNKINNVTLIKTECRIDLADSCIDIVLLYDVFHLLEKPAEVLSEFHRLLKPEGILSVNDHHMKNEEITQKITESGFFDFVRLEKYSHRFIRKD
ncbi:MAG: class I SAM-dependent methyltransferase [Candidatus Coatesbacteria bacterium]|nr:class I SAM-dependent methyltransferase [Candidatus Coatesbacteria bacterium]